MFLVCKFDLKYMYLVRAKKRVSFLAFVDNITIVHATEIFFVEKAFGEMPEEIG
jgi:hypothetical protein